MNTNFDNHFLSQLLEEIPDSVVWAEPVKDPDNIIIDFIICYSNQKADNLNQHPKGSLTGLKVL
ncbi:MAG TPA: hypothetical protein VGB63_15670, partial [Pedobacter sp.]